MYKKKFLFFVFEGIEGSGKTYQSKKLLKNLKKKKFQFILQKKLVVLKALKQLEELFFLVKKKNLTKLLIHYYT